MYRPQFAFITLALALFMLVGACALAPKPPAEDASIRGIITSVTPGADGVVSVLIESAGPAVFDYDKASVRVDRDTRVLRETDVDAYARVSADDLVTGMTVDAWFTGAVAESYPVQATAATIVIRE